MSVPTIGWPAADQARTPRGWSWPQPLMPARVEAWPRGQHRSPRAVDRLLAEAVGYWDAAAYRPGDRLWRNLGSAGELLDLQLGSSILPNSNEPLCLRPEDRGYVFLPNSASNYLTAVDEPALRITGPIDIRVEVAMNAARPAAQAPMVRKWWQANSYSVAMNADGTLQWTWSPDGTATSSLLSSSAISLTPGRRKWLQWTFTPDNGAGGKTAAFATSADNTTYSPVGTDVTTAGTTSIHAGIGSLWIGDGSSGTGMQIYRVQIRNGIDGTLVFDLDCDALASGSAVSITALTGQAVAITRSTSGVKSTAVPSIYKGGRAVFVLGTDDYFECLRSWQHQLLNFGAGDSFTLLTVIRQWGTPTAFGRYLDKKSGSRGYTILINGSNSMYSAFVDGVIGEQNRTNVNPYTPGQQYALCAVIDRSDNSLRTLYNGISAGKQPLNGLGSLANDANLLIGRSAIGDFQSLELFAAGVWRRGLPANETALLTNLWGS